MPLLQTLSPLGKLLFAVIIIMVSLVVVSLLGMAAGMLVFDIRLADLPARLSDYANPDNAVFLKSMQVVQAIGTFILPPLLLALFFSPRVSTYLGLSVKPRLIGIVVSIVVVFVSLPFINWLIDLNENMTLPASLSKVEAWMRMMEDQGLQLTEGFLNIQSFGGLMGNLLVMALLPAIGEELLFRGLFIRLFKDWLKNPHVAILLAAIIFSAFHMQFYGFVPRMVLGVIFGYLFVYTGSLWAPVIAHFINNAAAVVIDFTTRKQITAVQYEEFGKMEQWYWIALSFVASLLLIVYLKTTHRDRS
ncbi:MAG: CPBP family intramembrane metalloprotease [Bacteroidetes bacterium]|nr:CPBP family intramembrane metalloprotease [Bacteroidota bacterium]